jgi:tRNA A-37 threonylcarbamoyl transferase component Bud32
VSDETGFKWNADSATFRVYAIARRGIAMTSQPVDTSYEEWIGRVIDDRYRILDLLGEGGMGAVFAAEHLGLHKEVAFKVVRSELAGNAELAERFAREAMVTSTIDHVNVISALDFGTLQEGGAYLVMQLVRGKSLTETLKAEGTLHWSRAADLGAQIADALSAAQSHGIVHRDLKPDNVLIQKREDGSERVKILDFGIAKYSRDSLAPPPLRGARKLTRVGSVVGTPGYMAPEQAVGQKTGHTADLYSLGVILWESIAGEPLWQGEDIAEIVKNQLSTDPQPLREATGDLTIPQAMQELVARLLSVEPGGRPADAGAVRDVLRGIADAAGRELDAGRMLTKKPEAADEAAGGDSVRAGTAVAKTEIIPAESSASGDTKAAETVVSVETGVELRPRFSWRTQAMLGSAALVVLAAGAVLVMTGQLEVKPKGELDRLAKTVVPLPEEAVTNEADSGLEDKGEEPIPDDVRADLEVLVHGESRAERVTAAEALLRHVPAEEVPGYIRGIAYLQIAETCQEKKQELEKVEQLDDPRVLPSLLLLSDRRRANCGPKGNEDCLACLRSQLEALIERLEAKRLSGETGG